MLSANAIPSAARALPARISPDVSGETSNCSKEPSPRSLAINRLDYIMATMVIRMAKRPGTDDHRVSVLGLNLTRGSTTLSWVDCPVTIAASALKRVTISAV